MPRVRLEPAGTELDVQWGRRLLDAVDDCPEIGLPTACRGANCGVCRVRVESGGAMLRVALPREQEVLRDLNAPDTDRLACQIIVVDEPERAALPIRLTWLGTAAEP